MFFTFNMGLSLYKAEIPRFSRPRNIHVDVPGSMVHIQKATLKPEAFTDLHLPMTVTGGGG